MLPFLRMAVLVAFLSFLNLTLSSPESTVETPFEHREEHSNTSDLAAVHQKRATTASKIKALNRQGITGFMGMNGPAIGSWFRTDSGGDSTNGHSWCGYPYNDNSDGFAADVSVMLDNFDGNYEKAAKAYCGLEAIVTTPNGKSKKMYIIDGFDPRWVRTKGSIDITKNRFAKLYKATDDKDVVIEGIKWKLTGNRSKRYSFKGKGN